MTTKPTPPSFASQLPGATYLGEANIAELLLKVVNSMEDSRILLKKVDKGLRVGLRLALGNLAQSTRLVGG